MAKKVTKYTMKKARMLAGLSQKEAAERLGVHRQTLGKWERCAKDMPMGKAYEFSSVVGIGVDGIEFSV